MCIASTVADAAGIPSEPRRCLELSVLVTPGNHPPPSRSFSGGGSAFTHTCLITSEAERHCLCSLVTSASVLVKGRFWSPARAAAGACPCVTDVQELEEASRVRQQPLPPCKLVLSFS